MTLYFRQNLHVSNLSDLTAEVGVSVGFVAWVDGYGKYVAAPENTFTIDGLHVIAGQDGVQWADESSLYVKNWAVTDWYLDGYVGSDTNDGITESSPIKTGAELLRRLGPYAMWGQSVTVHVLANGMTDALILRGVMMVAGTHLDVTGTPTQVADAGTVATYTAVNHATPEATLVTATGITDWTVYQWKRIRCTTGTRTGTVTWVAKSNPAGAGVATARISIPVIVDLTSTITNILATTLVAGDTIVIEDLPTIPEVSIYLDGPIEQTSGAQYGKRQFSFTNVHVVTLNISASCTPHRAKSMIFGCIIEAIGVQNHSTTLANMVQLSACLFQHQDPGLSNQFISSGVFANCLFGGGIASVTMISTSHLNACLFQGTRLIANLGPPVNAFNCQSFDNPSSLSTVNISAGTVSTWSGSGNAGVGFVCINGSVVSLRGTMNVQGAITNCQLGTSPTINLTWSQFLQPSDFAQKGITPAMVDGYTLVTVPWYDNTIQRVTVNHASFGGTPGILSVQQISNTEFSITSSSSLDTSTVNWYISPLGRNIFISTSGS